MFKLPLWACMFLSGLAALSGTFLGHWQAQSDYADLILGDGKPNISVPVEGKDGWLALWQGANKGETMQNIYVVDDLGLTAHPLSNFDRGLAVRRAEANDSGAGEWILYGIKTPSTYDALSSSIAYTRLAQGTKEKCQACLQAIAATTQDKSVSFCWLNEVPEPTPK